MQPMQVIGECNMPYLRNTRALVTKASSPLCPEPHTGSISYHCLWFECPAAAPFGVRPAMAETAMCIQRTLFYRAMLVLPLTCFV